MANEARQETDGTALDVSGTIAEHDDCCCGDDCNDGCPCPLFPDCIDDPINHCCGAEDNCGAVPEWLDVTFNDLTDCGTDSCAGCTCDLFYETTFTQRHGVGGCGYSSTTTCAHPHTRSLSITISDDECVVEANVSGLRSCFDGGHTYTSGEKENCDRCYGAMPITVTNGRSCGGDTDGCHASGGTATVEITP